MARKLIGKEELLKIINGHLESLDECRNLHISAIVQDPGRTHGGNWTTSGHRRSGNNHDEEACAEAIQNFMAHLQATYDI